MIALDVVFAEADRSDTDPKQPSPWDASLARALAEGRVVLGYALTFGTDGGRRDCVLHPFAVPMIQPKDEGVDVPLFRAEGAICSLPALARAAGRSGFLNAVPDSDGILRRVPLVIDYDGTTYPGLALTAVLAATGAAPVALRSKNENTTSLELTTGPVPLDGRSNLLLRYRGAKRSFPYVSAVDVLAGRDAGDVFKNAIVFVGTTALGSLEVVSTPLDTRFAGVEVQATVADNLLRRDFLSRAEHALTIEVVTVLALGIAITLLVARVGLPLGTIAGAVFLVAVWFTMRWQLSVRGQYLSPFFPIVGMMASLGAATLARIAQERRRADRSGREKDLAQRLMVRSLLSLTEVRDADTGRHSRRIQQYSRLLAEELSHHPAFRDYLTPERVDLLSSLAPLHDIGKVGVPDHLLNKPGQAHAGRVPGDAETSGLRAGRDQQRAARRRRRRGSDPGDGQGHRLHPSRVVGWQRLSARDQGESHSSRGKTGGGRRRVRRDDRTAPLPAAGLPRGGGPAHRGRTRHPLRPGCRRRVRAHRAQPGDRGALTEFV